MNIYEHLPLLKHSSLISVIAVLFLSGCTSTPHDYGIIAERQPRSIVVIPPANRSVDVNAPYTYLSTISRPLAEKGYYVFPVAVIENFLKENGLPTPAEMNNVPLDKIREHIGADAALYVTIEDWGQKYQLISSKTVVRAKLRLVDTLDGALLWQTSISAKRSSSDNDEGNGILGAIVSAAVDQIAGSLTDHSYELSRQANNEAINRHGQHLFEGPYRRQDSADTHVDNSAQSVTR